MSVSPEIDYFEAVSKSDMMRVVLALATEIYAMRDRQNFWRIFWQKTVQTSPDWMNLSKQLPMMNIGLRNAMNLLLGFSQPWRHPLPVAKSKLE